MGWRDDIEWIVGIAGGVLGAAGTAVGLWERWRKRRRPGPRATGRSVPTDEAMAGFRVFTPGPTVSGAAVGLVDRAVELAALREGIAGRRSILAIEGPPGVGKSALAAGLCDRLSRRHRFRWVACHEQDLTLDDLATDLAFDPHLPRSRLLAAAATGPTERVPTVNAVVRYLARHRLVLVLDNYDVVVDDGVRDLVGKLAQSRTRSTLVLTSRQREVAPGPLVQELVVEGLACSFARQFVRDRGVEAADEVLDEVWARCGRGVPTAMLIFAGLTVDRGVPKTLGRLPVYQEDLAEWIDLLLADLTPDERRLAHLIAFVYEPTTGDLLRELAPPELRVGEALQGLRRRFVVSESGSRLVMHELFREHLQQHLDPADRRRYEELLPRHYQRRARQLLVPTEGDEEPSYGLLYLEAFPDYVGAINQHRQLVDDLVARLDDHGLRPDAGSQAVVLGSGNGIHDPGLVAHGLNVVNVELQHAVARLGRDQATDLAGDIHYVVADISGAELPLAPESVDVAFSLGSSFGYEDDDAENAAIFRHAARVLKPGRPFVLEYVNGEYWSQRRIERNRDLVRLPNGSLRTEYGVIDPAGRTSLTCIHLQRPDGTGGWFHHFMHYYTKAEIEQMLQAAGLHVVATYGVTNFRVSNTPFDPHTSTAMALLAIKP